MASFLTQCPGCVTSFRVTDTQLEAAEGMVRCGACLSVFSAPANRITLRNPVDPAQVPVLAPDAQLKNELDAAGYDVLAHADAADEEEPADAYDNENAALAEAEEDDADADEDTSADQDSGLWLVGDDGDRDVPLGDLDLDLHAYEDDGELEDDEDDEDHEDDEDDEDTDDGDDLDDDEDLLVEDDEDLLTGQDDEPDDDDDLLLDDEADLLLAADKDEPGDADEEDFIDTADDADAFDDEENEEALEEPEYRIVEEYVQEPRRAREPADKHELREYLAALEDDDALEPLDDYDADAFSEPVTITERQTVRRTLRFMGLMLLNLALLAVLVLQYVNANLDTLSRSPRLAPLMSRVCQVVECPLPEQSDLGSLSSQDLLVRSHPRYAGALEVSFIFRNDAPDAQPFPAIELGFSDASGQVIANRLFLPTDYLPPELQQLPAMPGQQTLQITLELADPGSEAVNYSIGFRAP